MSTTTTVYSYDEVPYKSYPYRQSHPARLATVATLLGLSPTPIKKCRVLEIGCASGGNLLPMADQLPQSEFVGIDLAQRSIQDAIAAASEAKLTNARFEQCDLADLKPDLGQFDYVIAHGVYSWISDAVQDALLRLCGELLTPHGVAYISYNTYPGWHMRGMIRDMMCYRARSFKKPDVRISQARALIDFLSQAVPAEESAYGTLLKNELNLIKDKDDNYLLHEHLEEHNLPVYFYQFVERARAHGLEYLGDADFRATTTDSFSKEVRNTLNNLSADVIESEQYMDFVRNRMFRQTLLCRNDAPVDRTVAITRLFGLHVSSHSKPEVVAGETGGGNESVTFRGAQSALTTSDPMVKAAMHSLSEAWPAAIPFGQLLAATRSKLRNEPVVADVAFPTDEAHKLADALMRAYMKSLVELSLQPTSFVTTPGEQPRVTSLTRIDAARDNVVTNLRHDMVRITDLQRHIVQFLDGSSNRSTVLDRLIGLVTQRKLSIHEHGNLVEDPSRVRAILEPMLEPNLRALARQCLLIA